MAVLLTLLIEYHINERMYLLKSVPTAAEYFNKKLKIFGQE